MIRKLLLTAAALLCALAAAAQTPAPSTYNLQRRSLFDMLELTSADLVFLGDSITDGAEWEELLGDPHAKNRGISGDRSLWLLDRLDGIVAARPAKLFVMIGINDLSAGDTPEAIVARVERLIDRFRAESPETQLYIQSLLPLNERFGMFGGHMARRDSVAPVNAAYRALCARKGATYIDLHPFMADDEGRLRAEYTNDGLHLTGAGYAAWREALKPYLR